MLLLPMIDRITSLNYLKQPKGQKKMNAKFYFSSDL